MVARTNTAMIWGIQSQPVVVEADMAFGLPQYKVVGGGDGTIRESGDRLRSAFSHLGLGFPSQRITVNLIPTDEKKFGSHYDLPIAVALLESMGICCVSKRNETAFFGEISLTGEIQRVKGILPLVLGVKAQGMKRVVVPRGSEEELEPVEEMEIIFCSNLIQVVDFLRGGQSPVYPPKEKHVESQKKDSLDYGDIVGQETIKRTLCLAAAGNHGILLWGSPGVGKTMLAQRLPTILPPLNSLQRLEVIRIYSAAGLTESGECLDWSVPFRAPHHTVSKAAMLGGGQRPLPGEISLAHRGVLFLDEIPLYGKEVMEGLREPLEKKEITIFRQGKPATFPADFLLVASGNPCKCGYAGDPERVCTCTPKEINSYTKRLSGPLLERIDLHVHVPRPGVPGKGPSVMDSEAMAHLVQRARAFRKKRGRSRGKNAAEEILSSSVKDLLHTVYREMGLSMRTYEKTIAVARTIADMEEEEQIKIPHIHEALQYRKE